MNIIIDKHGQRRVAQPGEILQDGETLVTALTAMDGLQHALTLDASPHRPGERRADADFSAADAANEQYERDLGDAWRTPTADATYGAAPTAPTADAREDAYAAHDAHLRDAWRQPQGAAA